MQPRRTSENFRDLLNDEFQRRLETNSRYSLRAFARDADVSAAFLSQVINGKRRLSEDRAETIAVRLGWNRARSERFIKFVRAELTSLPAIRERLLKEARVGKNRDRNFKSVSMNQFRVISDWYHFAILELSRLPNCKITPAIAAKRLGISEPLAGAAIARLKNLNLLVADGEGNLRKAIANYTTGNIPSVAIRNFHRQLLKKATAALETQNPIEREISGVTMAIDPAKLPIAKKMIADFRRELMATLEHCETPTAVYHLSVQLFRLDMEDQ